jgi:hypothetical protein
MPDLSLLRSYIPTPASRIILLNLAPPRTHKKVCYLSTVDRCGWNSKYKGYPSPFCENFKGWTGPGTLVKIKFPPSTTIDSHLSDYNQIYTFNSLTNQSTPWVGKVDLWWYNGGHLLKTLPSK